MMPFVIGDPKSLKCDYRPYWSIISACSSDSNQNGKIGYLSINETDLSFETTQRRPGIHTDRERMAYWGKVGGSLTK